MAGRKRSELADQVGPWFKALREALGPDVTALEIGRRMGIDTPRSPEAGRVLWSKLESGANQASSADVREAISRALTLSLEDIAKFLRGELTPRDLAKRAKLATVWEAADRARQAAVILDYPGSAIEAGIADARQTDDARAIFRRIDAANDAAFVSRLVPVADTPRRGLEEAERRVARAPDVAGRAGGSPPSPPPRTRKEK